MLYSSKHVCVFVLYVLTAEMEPVREGQGLPCSRHNHSVSSRHVTGHSWAHQPSYRYLSESTFQKDQNIDKCRGGRKEGERDKMRKRGENTTSRLRCSRVKQIPTLQPVGNPHTGASVYFLTKIQSVKSPGGSVKKGDEERVALRKSHIFTIIPYSPFSMSLLMWVKLGVQQGSWNWERRQGVF